MSQIDRYGAAGEPTVKVFLSYRRADDPFLAGRLRDRLAGRVGDDNVFFDVDSIAPGVDFRAEVRARLAESDVVVALIGPRWDVGRLGRPDDHVRMELAECLALGKPLIPLLIADTPMPVVADLPAELADLVYRNAVRVRPDPDFADDVAQLVEAIDELAHPRPAPAVVTAEAAPAHRVAVRRRRVLAVAALAVVTVAVTVLVAVSAGRDDGRSENNGGRWVAEVIGDDGARLVVEGGATIAGTEVACCGGEGVLAYVPTSGETCGICGFADDADVAVDLAAAGPGGTLHAPAWAPTGVLVAARTAGCTPGPDCADEVVAVPADGPAEAELVPAPALRGVLDIEVDPQVGGRLEDGVLALVDVDGAKLVRDGAVVDLEGGGAVTDLAYSPNSHVLAGVAPGGQEVQVWTRLGAPIATVDLAELVTTAAADGIDIGLDAPKVQAISVGPLGGENDQRFVLALSDGADVGFLALDVPYDADPAAQLAVEPVPRRTPPVPSDLHRDAELRMLVWVPPT